MEHMVSSAFILLFSKYLVIRDNPHMDPRRSKAFDTASRYHLIHSLAVLASPKAKYPLLTVGLFTGMHFYVVIRE